QLPAVRRQQCERASPAVAVLAQAPQWPRPIPPGGATALSPCLQYRAPACHGLAAEARTNTRTAARSAALARFKSTGASILQRRAPAAAGNTVTSHPAAMGPGPAE